MKTKSLMMIALAIFISASVFAQGSQGKQKMQAQNACMNIPDLTEDQQAKIKDLRTVHMKEVMPIKNELNEKRAKLKTISTGENVKIDEVYALIDEMGKLRTGLQKKQAKHKQDVRNILTEDQRVIFDMHSCKNRNKQHMMNK